MTSMDFDPGDLPLPKSTPYAPTSPRHRVHGGTGTPQNPAADGGDIDELSHRLTTLADQINQSNSARRGNRAPGRPGDSYLPSLFKNLTAPPAPQATPREPVFQVRATPAVEEPGRTPPPLSLEPDGRHWPQLPMPGVDVRALEEKIETQAAEIDKREIEIAELYVLRQNQTNDLKVAHHEIETLRQSLAELQQLAAQHEMKSAAATQRFVRAESEKAVLQAQIDQELAVSAELTHRLLDVEAALNDKSVDVTAHQETVERLRIELAETRAQTDRQVAQAEEKVDRRHYDERKLQTASFEKKLAAAQALIDERDRKIETFEMAYAELAACCDGLSRQILALEDAQRQAAISVHSQSEYIIFLETTLKVERANSEATLKELAAQFEHEREKMQAREREAAEIRKNIVLLLPKLAARREPEPTIETEPDREQPALEAQVA